MIDFCFKTLLMCIHFLNFSHQPAASSCGDRAAVQAAPARLFELSCTAHPLQAKAVL